MLAAVIVLTAWASVSASDTASKTDPHRYVTSIAITGAIGPATAKYVRDTLLAANPQQVEAVILRLNTPGGLATSMREIIADVLASPVPVIGFVAPAGAHAASAGTYILYAAHVAAMAPGTNLGAATPVQIGGPSTLPSPEPAKDKDGSNHSGSETKDAMSAKMTNDAVAFIRSLAELRHRNADWAEEAVREAASLSAQAALGKGVIDLVTQTPEELLTRIDGREVQVLGERRRLATASLPIRHEEPSWLIRLLATITDPNVAFILMMVGVYGLIFEFSNPGTVAPGVTGAICLVLGLYALNMLPVDYTGLALMLLGLAFLVAEAFNPTAVLGLGGLGAFLLGAMMLIDTDAPEFQISWTVLGGALAASFGLLTLTLGYVWRARHQPIRTGTPAMLGQPAEVLDWTGQEGHVLALGERWQARASQPLTPGEHVQIAGIQGLMLEVRRTPAAAMSSGGQP
ncbi:NfeD family protein [Microvirga calopogonii]|uniref:NfeD family protein n=1 Tax=Microvirga calopogonii TaxID=2078013 RepID=UPI000E0D8616|nr:nodulation protein NfeD [Microvirga calopogonii]